MRSMMFLFIPRGKLCEAIEVHQHRVVAIDGSMVGSVTSLRLFASLPMRRLLGSRQIGCFTKNKLAPN